MPLGGGGVPVGLFNANQSATPGTPQAQQKQEFWGAPYGSTPDALYRFDSNGDVDPNWALPAGAMNPWDRAYIQNVPVPGLVRITARKVQRKQKRTSPGDHGANVTMLGWDLAEVTLTTKLWTEDHFFRWQSLVTQLEQQITAAKTSAESGTTKYAGGLGAVKIEYPGLAMHKISQLYVLELFPPEPAAEPGVFSAKVVFEEFNPAQQGVTKTISGAPSAADGDSVYAEKGSQKNNTVAPPSKGSGTGPFSSSLQ